MLVNTVECKECRSIVYSRAEEDVRECPCGRVIVSGGQRHSKHEVIPGTDHEIKKINVHACANTIYDDWYNMEDKFGLITQKSDRQRASAY